MSGIITIRMKEGPYRQIIELMLVRAPHLVVDVISVANHSQAFVGIVPGKKYKFAVVMGIPVSALRNRLSPELHIHVLLPPALRRLDFLCC